MTIIGAIILALVVGTAEILPVSGTGHFYILDRILGVSLNQAERQSLQGVIYLGCALALLLYYRREVGEMLRALSVLFGIRRPTRQDRAGTFPLRLFLLLALSVLPMLAGLLILPMVRRIEAGEFGLLWITGMLVVSGILFYFTTRSAREKRELQDMTLRSGILIGLSQLPAIFPGLSRTGMTMAVALLLGFDSESAFIYSGLLGIPTFLAAGLLNVLSAGGLGTVSTPLPLSFAVFCLSAVAGILTLYRFSSRVREARMTGTAFWCWGAAMISLVLFLISA